MIEFQGRVKIAATLPPSQTRSSQQARDNASSKPGLGPTLRVNRQDQHTRHEQGHQRYR
jgi:hypothetical protein